MFVHLQHFATALIAQAADQPAARTGCLDQSGPFVPMLIMMSILYFIWIRPAQKERKTHQTMLEALKRGDDVIMTSGVFGTITDITDKTYVLEIAKNVKIKVLKSAVSRRAEDPKAAAKDEKSDPKSEAKADAKSGAKSE